MSDGFETTLIVLGILALAFAVAIPFAAYKVIRYRHTASRIRDSHDE